METIKLNVKLHENQEVINNCSARNIVINAGKRFGKTKLLVYKMVKAAFAKIDGMFWYVAPFYSQAKSIAWAEFRGMIPANLITRCLENELQLTVASNSTIKLLGADRPDTLRGPPLDGAGLDEFAYFSNGRYTWNNIIRGQLLKPHGETPGWAMFISSPLNPLESIGRNKKDFFPEFWQEARRKEMAGDKNWAAFHHTIYDNPTLSKRDIDEIRADSTDDEWNVEYLAKPSSYAGQVFSEFDYARDVMEWQVKGGVFVRGIDWGIAHPTVCLFVDVDMKNHIVYVMDEYRGSGNSIEESCEVIKKKSTRKVEWTICDPSLNKRNPVTKRPDKIEFDRNGVPCIPGDNNARGYNIVKMFLKKGIIKIHPKCRNLIKQLRDLQWSDKENDDYTDVLRYICVRVHDFMFSWKGAIEPEEAKPSAPNVYNLNDLFKGLRKPGSYEWANCGEENEEVLV